MPENETRIKQALVKAALMKRSNAHAAQLDFDFGESEQILAPLQARWQDALQKAKANRTVFAQRRIRPDEVLPEWQKEQQALGTQADVQRFLHSACARLNAPLEKARKEQFRLLPQHLPETLRLRLADEGINKALTIDFNALHRRSVHLSRRPPMSPRPGFRSASGIAVKRKPRQHLTGDGPVQIFSAPLDHRCRRIQ